MSFLVHYVFQFYQVSRSIGDAYLKRPEFSLDSSSRFKLSEPLRRPVLTAEPSVCNRVLQPNDKFMIFASDGLWEHITNEAAVEIVNNNPRTVCPSLVLRVSILMQHFRRISIESCG